MGLYLSVPWASLQRIAFPSVSIASRVSLRFDKDSGKRSHSIYVLIFSFFPNARYFSPIFITRPQIFHSCIGGFSVSVFPVPGDGPPAAIHRELFLEKISTRFSPNPDTFSFVCLTRAENGMSKTERASFIHGRGRISANSRKMINFARCDAPIRNNTNFDGRVNVNRRIFHPRKRVFTLFMFFVRGNTKEIVIYWFFLLFFWRLITCIIHFRIVLSLTNLIVVYYCFPWYLYLYDFN